MALLLLRVIDQRQIGAQPWPQLGCFDQDRLQVLVPLLGDGYAFDRLRRASFGTAQAAITDSLLDRVESGYIVDLEYSRQCGDRTDRRDGH